MKLLFKILNDKPHTEAAIVDTSFKNHYPDINRQMKWSEIEPYIRQATKLYIIPYIGLSFYNKIAEAYNDNSEELDPVLLELFQDAIAYYSIYQCLPQKAVVIASMGVQQSTPSEGSRPFNIADVKLLKYDTHLKADVFLDKLIEYLSEQSIDNEYYTDYLESKEAKYKTTLLFKHTSELDEYLNIQNARRTFIALTPYIIQAEEDILLPIIGELDINIGKTKRLAQKLIAEAMLINAIPNLSFVFEADGLRVISKGDSIEERNSMKNKEHENMLMRRLQKAKENADRYRTELIEFLLLNVENEEFSIWKESPFYKEYNTNLSSRIITSESGAIFL